MKVSTAYYKRVGKGLKITNLQKIRVKKNLSQSDLTELSDIKKRTIQGYEQGTLIIENASLKNLCSIASALNCKIDDILEDKELIKKYNSVK